MGIADLHQRALAYDAPSDFSLVVNKAETALYCEVALASLLLYYTITTMDKEVNYYWSRPLNRISVVYFLNRYGGLLSAFISLQLHVLNISKELCGTITWIHNIADWAIVLLINYILLIRVAALYSQSRRLLALLNLFLVLESSLRLAFMVMSAQTKVPSQKASTLIMTICVVQGDCTQPLFETLYWIIPLIYQITLSILAIYKAAEYWILSSGFRRFDLFRVLLVDQFTYFAMVIARSIINIYKCWIVDSLPLLVVFTVAGSTSFLCLHGSHLLFNLGEAREIGVNEGTNYRVGIVPSIELAEGVPVVVLDCDETLSI